MASVFPGRVQKISVNAGLGCPNRDGRLSTLGCLYCNNASFNPSYAHVGGKSITRQLEEGIPFFEKKKKAWGYLAYFQSFSNTYGEDEKLIGLYEEALAYPGIKGLVIATRPDCISPVILDYFRTRFGKDAEPQHPYLLVETGIESTNDLTLQRINRGHDWECAKKAVNALADAGIDVGAHLILGLPGETEDDFFMHIARINELPLKTLKLHQLQIIKGTPMAQMYMDDPASFRLFSAGEYASLVARIIKQIRPEIALDRFVSESPAGMVIAPNWGIKPVEFQQILDKLL